ncbi:MAG: thermonuclease family protein [Phycisphaerales bacterium]|nr:MAG: thermonuclease family protein [Phycisphaerales bacterium]
MRLVRHRSALPASIVLPRRWRRYGFNTLVVAIIAAGLVCARSAKTPVQSDDWKRYHDRSFRVAYVVDGDTLDIDVPDGDKNVTRIRLWGVDTPEPGRGGKPDMHFSGEAKAFAEQTLAGRRVHVVLSPKRTRGKYGRLLAYVFLKRGGPMFNEMLLEEGYAYADLRFDHHYYKRFQGVEKRARTAGVGLWTEVTLDKMPAWKQRFERRASKSGG